VLSFEGPGLIQFRVLGPFEVVEGEQPLALGGPKQQALLAVLLLHRGEVVSADRLIDELWGEHPPATAGKTLQGYISNLRKALGDGRLVTQGRGYLLEARPDQLDWDRFQKLAGDGRGALERGDAHAASERLREALALWRGPPLADFAYEQFAQSEIAKLEEARLAALEDRIDADLALGGHAALVSELEALVREHPLRERMQAQLMLALYRSGRQAEALAVYQDARRLLADELGLEPGRAVKNLEAAILEHDPAIDPPPPAGVIGRARATGASLPGWRRVALGGALLVAVAVLVALELASGAGSSAVTLEPASVGLIDPGSGRLRAAISVPGQPSRLAVGGGAVWVANDANRTLVRIAAKPLAITRTVAPGRFASDLAIGGGRVWAVDRISGRLVEYDPDYDQVVGSVAIPSAATLAEIQDRGTFDPWSVAVGDGGVWITDGSQRLRRVDPATGALRTFDMHAPVNGVAVGSGAVWAISGPEATVLRVDPRTGGVGPPIHIVARPGDEAPFPIQAEVGQGSVWILNANTATVTRIDPAQGGGVAATIALGAGRAPRRLAVGDGAAWIANGDGTLTRIDGTTNVASTTSVSRGLDDVGVGPQGVWVTAAEPSGSALPITSSPSKVGVRPLPAAVCTPVYFGAGTTPDRLIVADLPLEGDYFYAVTSQVGAAVQFVLRQNRFRAGAHSIGYQACDDSVFGRETETNIRCASNARLYAADASVIGVIGPFTSYCGEVELPIANSARGGPLAFVSPSATYPGLTRAGPGTAPGEPGVYAPTGTRSFVRVIAADDAQGAADAMLAHQLGLGRVFITDAVGPYGAGLEAAFKRAARRLGVGIAGRATFSRTASGYQALAAHIRATGANGVFIAGALFENGGRLVRDLRAGLGSHVQLLTPDGFAVTETPQVVGRAGDGMTISVPGVALASLPPAGKRFVRAFGHAIGQSADPYAVYAAQATQILLDAIARSDGTRTSVTRKLFSTKVHDGILGTFSITPTGDLNTAAVTIERLTNGQIKLLRVLTPPPGLLGR